MGSVPVRLLLFDVLEIAGSSVMSEPYRRRRELLERLVRPRRGVPVEVPAAASGTPEEAFDESRRLGLEGLVAKRPDSPYRPGVRSEDWLKLKLTSTQEVVIGGYRKGSGHPRRAASARCSSGSRASTASSTRVGSAAGSARSSSTG